MTQPQASPLITAEMQAAVGQESEPITVEVDKTACRMFARAVGYSDRIFYDEAYAQSKGYRNIPAPPGFLGHAVIVPGQPRPLRARFRRNTPLKRILDGGTDIEYFDTICAGDILTVTGKLMDVQERQGNIGLMLITVTELTYRNHQGQVVATLRGTDILY